MQVRNRSKGQICKSITVFPLILYMSVEIVIACNIFPFKHTFFLQINNPDMRVVILKEYAKKNFPATPLLDYAIEVEKITTSKVNILYINY